jgi:hypothetical protein
MAVFVSRIFAAASFRIFSFSCRCRRSMSLTSQHSTAQQQHSTTAEQHRMITAGR